MKIYIVAATSFELNAEFRAFWKGPIILSGIGAVQCTFALMEYIHLHGKPDLLIQVGIAGSFDLPNFPIGSVAIVNADTFADIGYKDNNDNFVDFVGGHMWPPNSFPFSEGMLKPKTPNIQQLNSIPKVQALTVNTVTSTDTQAQAMQQRFKTVKLESMEGAAAFYVCMKLGIEVIQLRAVSNRVGFRDTTCWNIPLAITRLNNVLISILDPLF
jgi:futalosine hydrolase